MFDVVLEYPADVDLVFNHGRLASLQILPAGWVKIEAAGWPTKGKALPIDITIEQTDAALTVTVHAPKVAANG